MSDPTRIIVYRNPAEAALWESGMIFPIMVAMALCVLAVLVTDKIMSYFGMNEWRRRDKFYVHAPLAAGIISAIATLWVML